MSGARPEWQNKMAETLRANGAPDRAAAGTPSWLERLFSWPRPMFAAAAFVMVLVTGWLGVKAFRTPSADQLLAQAYTERRTLEVRIPGAKYAPMRVERGGGSNFDKPESLLKAEALIGENLRTNPNDPTWLQAKARADLLDGNYESAIKTLQRALETQTGSPELLTDLGSAYFQRAESADRPIDYGNAIEELGKALAKTPDDPVALFNRALACERMFLFTQAVDDWQHYLRVDPTGPWADDARTRLAALQEKLKKHAERLAEPLLTPEEIAKAGPDHVTMRKKIDARIEDYLNTAVTEWLPKAFPVDQPKNGWYSRAALSILAKIASQKHDDQWLLNLLGARPSSVLSNSMRELALAAQANARGDADQAISHARDAQKQFRRAGNSAGALRSEFEYLVWSESFTAREPLLVSRYAGPRRSQQESLPLANGKHAHSNINMW